MAPLYVGIDLGGSGTRAALADADGSVVAVGRGPSAGHLTGSAGRRRLARALDAALAPIAPMLADVNGTVVQAGTRGLSVPGRRESLILELGTRFPRADVRVSNDALIALWGGLAGGPGVAVLAGTGSIALARGADGREGRAGGWGYLLGDEGSGFWIGREAVVAYLRHLESRGPSGSLTQFVRSQLGRTGADVPSTIAWVTQGTDQIERVATLAPLVSRAAADGDPVAVEIFARAATALAELVATAAHQVWPCAAASPRVARCGGLWAAGSVLEAPFAAALARVVPGAVAGPPALPPVGGALLMALGSRVTPEVTHRVLDAFPRTGI